MIKQQLLFGGESPHQERVWSTEVGGGGAGVGASGCFSCSLASLQLLLGRERLKPGLHYWNRWQVKRHHKVQGGCRTAVDGKIRQKAAGFSSKSKFPV